MTLTTHRTRIFACQRVKLLPYRYLYEALSDCRFSMFLIWQRTCFVFLKPFSKSYVSSACYHFPLFNFFKLKLCLPVKICSQFKRSFLIFVGHAASTDRKTACCKFMLRNWQTRSELESLQLVYELRTESEDFRILRGCTN